MHAKGFIEDVLDFEFCGVEWFSLRAFPVDWSAAERVVLGDLLSSAFLPKASN